MTAAPTIRAILIAALTTVGLAVGTVSAPPATAQVSGTNVGAAIIAGCAGTAPGGAVIGSAGGPPGAAIGGAAGCVGGALVLGVGALGANIIGGNDLISGIPTDGSQLPPEHRPENQPTITGPEAVHQDLTAVTDGPLNAVAAAGGDQVAVAAPGTSPDLSGPPPPFGVTTDQIILTLPDGSTVAVDADEVVDPINGGAVQAVTDSDGNIIIGPSDCLVSGCGPNDGQVVTIPVNADGGLGGNATTSSGETVGTLSSPAGSGTTITDMVANDNGTTTLVLSDGSTVTHVTGSAQLEDENVAIVGGQLVIIGPDGSITDQFGQPVSAQPPGSADVGGSTGAPVGTGDPHAWCNGQCGEADPDGNFTHPNGYDVTNDGLLIPDFAPDGANGPGEIHEPVPGIGGIFIPDGWVEVACQATGTDCGDFINRDDTLCQGQGAATVCIVPEDLVNEDDPDDDTQDPGPEPTPTCTYVPSNPLAAVPPTPPTPAIGTSPGTDALVQMDIFAWDTTAPTQVTWTQPGSLGRRTDCSTFRTPYGYAMAPVFWQWNFSTDGHDPHGTNAQLGQKGAGYAGTPGNPSGVHAYRDDATYTIGLSVRWVVTVDPSGAGLGQTQYGSATKPFDVYEIRSGQTGS